MADELIKFAFYVSHAAGLRIAVVSPLVRALRTLGAEVARAAEHFAVGRITSPEAERAEATLQPVSESEARRAKSS